MTPVDGLWAEDERVLAEAVDRFVSERLAEAGVWTSPRTSDGVGRVRVVRRDADVVRLCGWLWDVEHQERHVFWLDVERGGDEVRWALYWEVDPSWGSRHRRENAVDIADDPADVRWVVTLTSRTVPSSYDRNMDDPFTERG